MLKHNDNLEKKEKVKYDLYKIHRMRVLLNQGEVDNLTLNKFKEASLNIDKMLSDEYNAKLDTMFYNTETLEDEEKRLKDLVAFINERMEKRKSLLEDYRNVTSKELTDLEYIDKYSELDLYSQRLSTIKEYLDNSKLIEVNGSDLEKIKEELVKEYDLKSANELKNMKIEENLFDCFVNALYEMDLYSSLDLDNIDKELENLQKEIAETKEQKDTFLTAFNNLKLSGISGDLELEYASYVENSKRNYYYVKEKEIILKLYKLLEEKEAEYSNLFAKREKVKELLNERMILRMELSMKDKDHLIKIAELVREQDGEIDNEKENVDNINVLTERIKLKESRLEELNKSVRKPEILSILKEYALIDTYEHDDILDEDIVEEVLEDETIYSDNEELEFESNNLLEELLKEDEEEEITLEQEKVYKDNQIKESSVVPTMNYGLSRLKSISVMKRVGDMLGLNAKKEEVKEPVKEEEKIVEVKPEVTSDVVEEKHDDLFWTPVEFVDMQKETEVENNIEFNIPELIIPEVPKFEEESKEEVKETDIFANSNDGMIFPEPVMPVIEQKVLPENKEEKFMWPDNMETFDINGIFPN